MKMINGAARYRVAGAPGLYLARIEDSVFAYLRVGDDLYAGAGGTVLAAVSDVFGTARPGVPVPREVLLVLPTIDRVAVIGATS